MQRLGNVSRSAQKLSDRKAQQPGRPAGARPPAPRPLSKVELVLPDGRYVLAYAKDATGAGDA